MSALAPFVTPDQFAALQKQVAELRKQLAATNNNLPPDYGIANKTQRGLLGPVDYAGFLASKAKTDAAAAANTAGTLVLRDGGNNVALTGLATNQHTAWTSVLALGTFTNNWTNEPTSPIAQYRRDALGFGHLRGVVYRSTGTPVSNEIIFTLPAGFRPTSSVELLIAITNTGAGQVNINSDGTVRWRSGGTTFLSLSLPPFEVVAL